VKPALVLALNPSIDAEWRVAQVQWEEKNTVETERRWAGGKGINVARWLRHLGGQPRLLLPLGGPTGIELAAGLRAEGILANILPLREPTRVNVIVTTVAGRQLRFNPAGPKLSRQEWDLVLGAVQRSLPRAALLILSGSLPRGLPVTAYARLIRQARRLGVKALLDCDGEALAAGVKARPFLVKPNEQELAQWRGRRLRTEAEMIRAARALSEATGGWVLISRGPKPALLLNQATSAILFARPPRLTPRNSVGAGDALLASVARQIQLGARPGEWLRNGVAIGCAATRCAAGGLPPARLVQKLLRRIPVPDEFARK
jgi:1-phosphofructokinase family hexose kinase